MSDSATTRPALEEAVAHATGTVTAGGAPPQAATPAALERWGPLEAVAVRAVAHGVTHCRARDAVAGVDVELRLFDLASSDLGRQLAGIADDSARRAQLRHPHLLWVLGAEEHRGKWGIWTEKARGHTLASLVRERGPLNAAQAAALGGELCGALAALHAHGLAQGELDATCVLIASDGRARLRDPYPTSGASASEAAEVHHATSRLAPDAHPTAADDLYALGGLLLLALKGDGADLDAARAWLRDGTVRCVGERDGVDRRLVPELLAQAIVRATDPHPSLRYPSAVAMAAALTEAHDRATRTRPGERVEQTVPGDDDRAPSGRRRLWPYAALVLVTLVALGLMAVIVWTAAE